MHATAAMTDLAKGVFEHAFADPQVCDVHGDPSAACPSETGQVNAAAPVADDQDRSGCRRAGLAWGVHRKIIRCRSTRGMIQSLVLS